MTVSNQPKTPRLLAGFGAAAIAVAMVGGCSSTESDSQSDSQSESHVDRLVQRLETPGAGDVMIAAHRTCWRNNAENSIAGIEACIALGIEIIEIDVRKTADGELILMHDETVDRTTNGSGKVSELTLAEIRTLRLKSGDGGSEAATTDESVPTLAEALQSARGRILVNLDIKEAIFEEVLEIATEAEVLNQLLIKTVALPGDDSLYVAELFPSSHFMPIIIECPNPYNERCVSSIADVVTGYREYAPVAFEIVNRTDQFLIEGVPGIVNEDARLWVNTLGPGFAAGRSDEKSLTDPDGNWGFIIDHGVNIIQTDRPEELMAYLEERSSRSTN